MLRPPHVRDPSRLTRRRPRLLDRLPALGRLLLERLLASPYAARQPVVGRPAAAAVAPLLLVVRRALVAAAVAPNGPVPRVAPPPKRLHCHYLLARVPRRSGVRLGTLVGQRVIAADGQVSAARVAVAL